jgi:hypothetical protein
MADEYTAVGTPPPAASKPTTTTKAKPKKKPAAPAEEQGPSDDFEGDGGPKTATASHPQETNRPRRIPRPELELRRWIAKVYRDFPKFVARARAHGDLESINDMAEAIRKTDEEEKKAKARDQAYEALWGDTPEEIAREKALDRAQWEEEQKEYDRQLAENLAYNQSEEYQRQVRIWEEVQAEARDNYRELSQAEYERQESNADGVPSYGERPGRKKRKKKVKPAASVTPAATPAKKEKYAV